MCSRNYGKTEMSIPVAGSATKGLADVPSLKTKLPSSCRAHTRTCCPPRIFHDLASLLPSTAASPNKINIYQ